MTDGPQPVERRSRGPFVAMLCLALALPSAALGSATLERAGSLTSAQLAAEDAVGDARTALWPFFKPHRAPLFESQPHNVTPHPAVARIIVPEGGVTAFGSGTLVDVREKYGLVVTNWHVVRDARGAVEVKFPGGFCSQARPLKVDSNWDLAALVIWRPPIEPVRLASQPPRPGDVLTIHGYGRGQYRIATGRCTTYYAPRMDLPLEMVELDVEARQGDSGGPIFNERGELAGVLFGAGQGTTLGSYAPRVSNFLATLAPDIGQAHDQALVDVAARPAPDVQPLGNPAGERGSQYPSAPWSPRTIAGRPNPPGEPAGATAQLTAAPPEATAANNASDDLADLAGTNWYESIKSALAVIGILAIALHLMKAVR